MRHRHTGGGADRLQPGDNGIASTLRQHHRDAAVEQLVLEAIRRKARIERHVGPTGLEHRHQRRHHLTRALRTHADENIAIDRVAFAEHVGKTRSALIERRRSPVA